MLDITPEVQRLIDRALEEDQAFADATTQALIDPSIQAVGEFRAEEAGTLAGISAALAVFQRLRPSADTQIFIEDGDALAPGQVIATVTTSAEVVLRGERLALNLLQRMSGIATETAGYVKAVEGTHARIIDTRKTAPGLRTLDKYAVRVGGGHNHRMHLGDGILIKDNHLYLLDREATNLSQLIHRARERASHTLKIEVEVTNLHQLEEALEGHADIVLLDNMSVEDMAEAVRITGGRALLEASGGITIDNVAAVASTGVDLISVGALTHSVKALDISMDISTIR